MIVPDLNLLIYAHNDEASQHVAARRWWEGLLSGQERVGLPWVVITGFVRLMTHPKSVARTISPDAAMDYVQHWLEFPHVAPLNPGSEHLVHFRNCLATVGVGGNLVRIMTRPSLLARPVTTGDAMGYVREWLNHSHVSLLNPGPMHLDHVERNLAAAGMGGNL